jgi:hypothetical protein
MTHPDIQKLITDFATILDRDPMDQMEDTPSILSRFTKLIAKECAGIAHGSDMPGPDIKYHFGIEE